MFKYEDGLEIMVGDSVLLEHGRTPGTVELIVTTAAILVLGSWLTVCSADPPDLQSYGTTALLDVERLSRNFFRLFPPEPAKEIQAFYVLWAYRAYKAGAIDKPAYSRALALALTRDCILHERTGDAAGAAVLCREGAANFDAWHSGGRYDEFRNEVESDDFDPSKAP
jgi:hypothetical protein